MNSSMSPSIAAVSPVQKAWSPSGYSMKRAPGIAAASFAPSAAGTWRSVRLCSTKVGTRTEGRISPTSILVLSCMIAFTAPGLADSRSSLPNWATASELVAWDVETVWIMTPRPQPATMRAILSSVSAEEPRSAERVKPPTRTRCETSSGQVAANSALMAQPSEKPMTAARREPAASITARTSSMRCSSEGAPVMRSDRPWPRLSKAMTRAKDASRRRKPV